jgi:hypothetical protein
MGGWQKSGRTPDIENRSGASEGHRCDGWGNKDGDLHRVRQEGGTLNLCDDVSDTHCDGRDLAIGIHLCDIGVERGEGDDARNASGLKEGINLFGRAFDTQDEGGIAQGDSGGKVGYWGCYNVGRGIGIWNSYNFVRYTMGDYESSINRIHTFKTNNIDLITGRERLGELNLFNHSTGSGHVKFAVKYQRLNGIPIRIRQMNMQTVIISHIVR